jgi:hypothetical protein
MSILKDQTIEKKIHKSFQKHLQFLFQKSNVKILMLPKLIKQQNIHVHSNPQLIMIEY